jgi:tetratricopeptide (TPR) repeat protein
MIDAGEASSATGGPKLAWGCGVGEQQQPATDSRRFGSYLRRIREERRLSLDAVEEMSLGLPERVTKSHLSRIENGQAIPSFPRMFTLSQIYGVPVSSLAERFELCLKAQMIPPEAVSQTLDQVLDHARALRRGGRHGEALVLYEIALDRAGEVAPEQLRSWTIDLELECINCLTKLCREATAKDECERLLSSDDLDLRQQLLTLQYFAMSCYRLGKFTVAMMAMERAEQRAHELGDPRQLGALSLLKGNIQHTTKRYSEAVDAYRKAISTFEECNDTFEACRSQVNLAASLIELGDHGAAREQLKKSLLVAETAGYDRQHAFALSHLALIAYREEDFQEAEAQFLRSNRLARSREYIPVLFRNCFYLWRIARARGDGAGAKSNERTLRSYLTRAEGHVPEVEEFRAFLGGGDHV